MNSLESMEQLADIILGLLKCQYSVDAYLNGRSWIR